MHASVPKLFASMFGLTLAACGGSEQARQTDAANTAATGAALPMPAARGGSITGMPDHLPAASTAAAPAPLAAPSAGAPDDPPAPGTAASEAEAEAVADEAGADAAVELIRDYHAAVNRNDPMAAHALWRDPTTGAAQFAVIFADSRGVSVQIGEPGAVRADAGRHLVEVPVSLVTRQADGSERRYRGRYLLQRADGEGTGEDPHPWRIAAAELRQLP